MSEHMLLAVAVAITVVFTQGSIFQRVRSWGPKLWQELANCSLCAGTWIGMLCTAFAIWPVPTPDYPLVYDARVYGVGQLALIILGNGCITGTLAYMAVKLMGVLNEADAWLEKRNQR